MEIIGVNLGHQIHSTHQCPSSLGLEASTATGPTSTTSNGDPNHPTCQAQNSTPLGTLHVTTKGSKASVTRIDLHEQSIRQGLGPATLKDLGIEPEFIGINKKTIIIDYPSPQEQGNSNFGLEMSETIIQQCRNSWLFIRGTIVQEEGKVPCLLVKPHTRASEPNYYVEFPPEENETTPEPSVAVENKVIGFLIEGFQRYVSLKRGREDDWRSTKDFMGAGKKKISTIYAHGRGGGPNHAPNSAMKILSWNYRDVVASATARELRELCKGSKPTVVFLMETKHATTVAFPAVSSDHTPILFKVIPEESSGTTFKYELMWDEHPDFQRRGRNKIVRLKDEEGNWVSGQKDLEKAVASYYSKVFSTEGTSNLSECLQVVPRLVSNDLNQRLRAEVTDEEIKSAVDGLGALKAPGPDGFNGLFFKSH
ncbi:hypothetical protein SESBI_42246 [Sesbania bispinosa]|nr:hypothetical protein SESBI_42246 [Sesbania bispinosa]